MALYIASSTVILLLEILHNHLLYIVNLLPEEIFVNPCSNFALRRNICDFLF